MGKEIKNLEDSQAEKVSGGWFHKKNLKFIRMTNNTSMSDEDFYKGVIEGTCPFCGKKYRRVSRNHGAWRNGFIGGDMWDPSDSHYFCCDSKECQDKATAKERKRWGIKD